MTARRFTDEQEAQIAAEYDAGDPAPTIAARWQAGPETIRRAILRQGGSMRAKTESNLKQILLIAAERRTSDSRKEKIVRLYSNLGSICRVAEDLSCSIQLVANVLEEFGIERCGHKVGPWNERYFQAIDTPDKAYWLGMLGADGCVTGGSIILGLQRRDRAHVEAFAKAVGYPGSICDYEFESTVLGQHETPKRWKASNVSLHSQAMATDLHRLGVTERKSLTLRPWQGPKWLLPHYYRGLVDGDGWVCHYGDNRAVLGLCGSRDTMSGFSEFVRLHVSTNASVRPVGRIWKIAYAQFVAQEVVKLLRYNEGFAELCRKGATAAKILAMTGTRRASYRRSFSLPSASVSLASRRTLPAQV